MHQLKEEELKLKINTFLKQKIAEKKIPRIKSEYSAAQAFSQRADKFFENLDEILFPWVQNSRNS